MTNPIPPATIAKLRELIKNAGEWPDLGPEDQSAGSFRCPLCDGQGDIEAEHVKDGRREYGDDSWFSIVGIQVYGIGDAMAAMEALLPLLIKHTPSLLDQLDAQAAEIERVKFEREALVNAAICGQRSLHSDMIKRWNDLRDAVLHGLDGLDNDQTNAVLDCIDDHFPSDIKPAVAEESSDTENRADKAEARVAELEGLLRKHAAIKCGACMGTGSYLGDEDRDGPCEACGGARSVLPEEVATVLARCGSDRCTDIAAALAKREGGGGGR